jgi:hypothetical protein
MQTTFKKPFAQFVKKSTKFLQLAISDAVEDICKQPDIGELKVGDLAGIRVHKFRLNQQQYLIAYKYLNNAKFDEIEFINFYKVGSHENFYLDLKKYLRQVGKKEEC